MSINFNSRILLSLAAITIAGAMIVGATLAFFSDTETSVDNTLTAGALDLKVDSEAHYNGLVCRNIGTGEVADYRWLNPLPDPASAEQQALDHYDTACDGTWAETDLGVTNQFFQLVDIKPGDDGENTISLHVYDNDAWGRFVIDNVEDLDNSCTEPEGETELGGTPNPSPTPGCTSPDGELAENISFYAWLDQGATPGFQNVKPNEATQDPSDYIDTNEDTTEGDNIWDCEGLTDPNEFVPGNEDCDEPLVILPGGVDPAGETHNIWPALAAVDTLFCNDLQDPEPANGHNDYGVCHGIANDGRMVGSTTYYFGLAWSIPDEVTNVVQTDSLNADLSFEVEQHRNNPSPF